MPHAISKAAFSPEKHINTSMKSISVTTNKPPKSHNFLIANSTNARGNSRMPAEPKRRLILWSVAFVYKEILGSFKSLSSVIINLPPKVLSSTLFNQIAP